MVNNRTKDATLWLNKGGSSTSNMFTISDVPELVGSVRSVSAATDDNGIPALDIGIQRGGAAAQVVTLKTKDLATNVLLPSCDQILWNYLPSWYFDASLAAEAMGEILKKDMFNYPARYEFDTGPSLNKKFAVYKHTLAQQHEEGFLGRYTLRAYKPPKTVDGVDVYKLVVDSCTVCNSSYSQ